MAKIQDDASTSSTETILIAIDQHVLAPLGREVFLSKTQTRTTTQSRE